MASDDDDMTKTPVLFVISASSMVLPCSAGISSCDFMTPASVGDCVLPDLHSLGKRGIFAPNQQIKFSGFDWLDQLRCKISKRMGHRGSFRAGHMALRRESQSPPKHPGCVWESRYLREIPHCEPREGSLVLGKPQTPSVQKCSSFAEMSVVCQTQDRDGKGTRLGIKDNQV